MVNPSFSARLRGDRPLVIAHRGDSKKAPENTMPAFESAVAVGADVFELDYRHAKDGVPIVIHDDILDRTTNAKSLWGGEKIKLDTKTAKELEALDAGSWFNDKFAGTKLPLLEETLKYASTRILVMIERKDGDAMTCLDLLQKLDLVDGVGVFAFDWDYLRDMHRLDNLVPLGALGKGPLDDEKLSEAASFGATLVGWKQEDLDEKSIKAAKERGLVVWSWTIDNPDRAKELVSYGLDGIISNVPTTMLELVKK